MSENEKVVKEVKWRWIVLITAFLILVIISIPLFQFSILFQDIIAISGAATVLVSWIFNLFQVMFDTSATFAGPLCDKLGYRKLAFTCGFILSLSLLLSGFVSRIELLFLTYSLMAGISCGSIYTLVQYIVPLYFVSQRGTAVGILNSGLSIGQFIGPFFVNALRNEYSRYFLLVMSAVYLHICLLSLTFLSPKSLMIDKNHSASSSQGKEIDLVTVELENKHLEKSSICSFRKDIQDIFVKIIENMKLLKYHKVKIIVISIALMYASQFNFVMMIPLALSNEGMSEDFIGWCYSVIATFDLISRLLAPILSDLISMSKKWYILLGSLLMAVSIIGFTLTSIPAVMLTCLALFGISAGCTTGMHSIIIIEFMGIDMLPQTYGTSSVFIGSAFLIFGPAIGLIRDLTSNFFIAINSISILCFTSVLLWIIMPCTIRRDEKLKKEISKKNKREIQNKT